MASHQEKETKSGVGLGKFLFVLAHLYNEYKYSRPRKVLLNRDELEVTLNALDAWIEGFRGTADEDADVLESLHDMMSRAMDVRMKLWESI